MTWVTRQLGVNVLTAAEQRITALMDSGVKILVAFSGGKDSTVMLHIAAKLARARGVRIGAFYMDLEGMYALTTEHVAAVFTEYADVLDAYWVCLPIHLRNATSVVAPFWVAWDPKAEERWIRPLPTHPTARVVSDPAFFPFFRHAMEFEEFVPLFASWYAAGQTTATLVGIRADESLNRRRTIFDVNKTRWQNAPWTTMTGAATLSAFPIYDWAVADVWTYHAKTGARHNGVYDRMHLAGLTLSAMRICQPYGDDQKRGLWLFHLIEPQTWVRVVERVCGANAGALYAKERGNINGVHHATLPPGMTWKAFADHLLTHMPAPTAEHYRNKIYVFQQWWAKHGVPDLIDADDPAREDQPSWQRVCRTVLKNDYWCKRMGFAPTKSAAYARYTALVANRRKAATPPSIDRPRAAT